MVKGGFFSFFPCAVAADARWLPPGIPDKVMKFVDLPYGFPPLPFLRRSTAVMVALSFLYLFSSHCADTIQIPFL